jgi:hypothetical protein
MKNLYFIILFTFLLTLKLSAQNIVWQKEQDFSAKSSYTQGLIDKNGNIIVLGNYGPIDSINHNNPYEEFYGWFLSRLDSEGNQIWSYKTICKAGPSASCIDDKGNIYLTGRLFDSINFGNNITLKNMESTYSSPGFLAKYSSNGTCLWAQYLHNIDNNCIFYYNEKIITLGEFTTDREDTINYNTNSGLHGIISVFDSDGNYILDKKYPEKIFSSTCIKNNKIYTSTRSHNSNSSSIEKYTIEGDLVRTYSNIHGTHFVLDKDENFYFCGSYLYNLQLGDISLVSNQKDNNWQSFFAKCNSLGDFKWAHNLEGSSWINISPQDKLIALEIKGNLWDSSSECRVSQFNLEGNKIWSFVKTPSVIGYLQFDQTEKNLFSFSTSPQNNALAIKICLEACVTSSEKEKLTTGLYLYPNPVWDEFTVYGDILGSEIEITDVLGRNIYSMKKVENNNVQIQLPNKSKGIYFVKVIKGEAVETKKIVVY